MASILKLFKIYYIFYNYINATYKLNWYKYFIFPFFALRAGIRNIPGKKFNPKGYNIDSPKLNKVSLIKCFCVFLYTAQKQETKYQKKVINKNPIKKNIANFILKHVFIFFDFFSAFL